MKKGFKTKPIALLLTFAMLAELSPVGAVDLTEDPAPQPSEETVAEQEPLEELPAEAEEPIADEKEPTEPATVVGEITELREETVKHFRMDNGSFIAVEYGMPVHFTADNGETWQDIDNTLTLTETADANEEQSNSQSARQTFMAKNGDTVTSFAETLADGFLFSSESGKHKITLSLASPSVDTEPKPDVTVLPAMDINTTELIESAQTEATVMPASEAEISYPLEDKCLSSQFDSNVEGKATLSEQVMPKRLSADISYRNVYDGVDLSYTLSGYNIKESIIIKEQLESYEFSFCLDVGDLNPKVQDDGSILLADAQGQPEYVIPAPYMLDASDNSSDAVTYSLRETDADTWMFTVVADREWINDSARVFPVTIDPTLEIHTDSSHKPILTSYVQSIGSAGTDNQYSVYVGKNGNKEYKGLVYIRSLPELPEGALITYAALIMGNFTAIGQAQYPKLYSSSATVADANPEYYLNHATWDQINDISYGGSMNPSERNVLDYAKITQGEYTYHSWNITSLMQSWYDGSGPSRLMILDEAGNTDTRYSAFYGYKNSSYRPYMIVHYQNTVGLEDYYSYQSQNIAKAGVGSVNNYTLNLTVSTPIASCPSTVLPFSVGLYYNSARATGPCTGNNHYITRNYGGHVGNGWKLSLQQTVYSLSISELDGTTAFYLVYMDADGTEHYFKYDSEKSAYCDEDGLNRSITISQTSSQTVYTMKDDSNNVWEFFNGFLTKFTDNNGNSLYYCYDNVSYSESNENWKPAANGVAHKVSSVYRKNDGSSTTENLVTLTYNGNQCLNSITDKAGRTTTFSYESRTVNGTTAYYLKQISYPDSSSYDPRYACYNYLACTVEDKTVWMLDKAYDNEADYGIHYSYLWTLGQWRIKDIVEYHMDGAQEITRNKLRLYKAGAHHTKCRSFGADLSSSSNGAPSAETKDDIVTIYNFDDFGHLTSTCTTDDDGNILGASTGEYTKKEGTKPDNNRLTKQAAQGKSSRSLLNNGGQENTTDAWTYWEYGGSYANGIRAKHDADNPNENQFENGVVPHSGKYALKTWVSSNNAANTAQAVFYRPVQLNANTAYTFSAYINTNKITDFRYNNVGVFFAIPATGTGSQLSMVAHEGANYHTNATASGWERVSVTYSPRSNGTYWVGVSQTGAAGCAYFDDLQLEQLDIASSVNLLSNGSFEDTPIYHYWNMNNDVSRVFDSACVDGQYVMKLNGTPDTICNASQTVVLEESGATTYILSGWGKADSAPNAHNEDLSSWEPFFGLIASIVYKDSSEPAEQHRISFASNTSGWQYASGAVVPKHPEWEIDRIHVFVSYHNNINTAYFDNISLTREPVQTYSYDSENGKLLSATQTGNDESTYQYDNKHRMTEYKTLTGVTYTLSYSADSYDPSTVSSDNTTTTYTYDSAGNNTKTKLTAIGTSYYQETSAIYDNTKNFQESATDINGITTTTHFDSDTGYKTSSTVPVSPGNGTASAETEYSYYSSTGRSEKITLSDVIELQYYYAQNGLRNQITRRSLKPGTNDVQAYSYSFDDWGQRESVKVRRSRGNGLSTGRTLALYDYYPNGNMSKQFYSNGDRIEYSYDILDRPIQTVYYDGNNHVEANYSYIYNAQGNLAQQYATDATGNKTQEYKYEYDSLGRLIRSKELGSGGTVRQRTEHLYDTANRPTEQRWSFGDTTYSEHYYYNDPDGSTTTPNDGSLASMTTATGDKLVFGYDTLKRPTTVYFKDSNDSTLFYRVQNYKTIGNKSTNQISGFAYRNSADDIINYNTYEYDAAGNISKIYQSLDSGTRELAQYSYDIQNQLTTEVRKKYIGNSTNASNTVTTEYSYDTAGNLLTKACSNGDNYVFTYGNDDWQDLLTHVKVNTYYESDISYDTCGNPLNWYNGSSYTDLTWTQGRRLSSLKKGNTQISYAYDMDGIRNYKSVGNTAHYYITQNGRVVRETYSGYMLDFIYDVNGRPFALNLYNYGQLSATYYYILNYQGDVVALINSSGTTVASYTYDAWGNILTATGSMATMNPLRYRGYYYDSETGFYYLQSRYYDPEIGRFINADNFGSTGQGIVGYNMFAYCNNNPILFLDPNGKLSKTVIDSTESTKTVSKDGGYQYTVKIHYHTVPLHSLISYWLLSRKSFSKSVVTFNYYYTARKTVSFSFSNNTDSSSLQDKIIRKELAKSILLNAQGNGSLLDRTERGISLELNMHRILMNSNVFAGGDPCDIGAVSSDTDDYDYNASWFEHPITEGIPAGLNLVWNRFIAPLFTD